VKHILLYPAGIAQKEVFLIAKKRKFSISTVDVNPNAECKDFADNFYNINPADYEDFIRVASILKKKNQLNGIMLVGADLAENYSKIVNRFNLIGPSVDSAKLTVLKYEMKKKFQKNNINHPKFSKVLRFSDISLFMQKYGLNSKSIIEKCKKVISRKS